MPYKDPEKKRANSRKYYEANRKRIRKYQEDYRAEGAGREYNLQRKYGISLADYEEMFESQDGRCAICLEFPGSGELLHVDHCHVSGTVRGLLCGNCNRGIGLLKDDVPRILRAAEYLRGTS